MINKFLIKDNVMSMYKTVFVTPAIHSSMYNNKFHLLTFKFVGQKVVYNVQNPALLGFTYQNKQTTKILMMIGRLQFVGREKGGMASLAHVRGTWD